MNGETCNEARLKFSLAGEVADLPAMRFSKSCSVSPRGTR